MHSEQNPKQPPEQIYEAKEIKVEENSKNEIETLKTSKEFKELADREKKEIDFCIHSLDEKDYKDYKAILKILTKYNFIKEFDLKFFAMKLTVLFGNAKNLEKYLKLSINANTSPAEIITKLNLPLPKNLINKELWHKILKISDDLVLMREVIPKIDILEDKIKNDNSLGKNEKIRIKQAHTNITKEYLLKFLAKQRYNIATEEDIEDGIVFNKHNLSQESFNEWLELKKEAKNSDKVIPAESVFLDGSTLGQNDRYLIKMRFNDPRLAVLGHILDCCQSINATGKNHVYEDTKLEDVGIFIIAKDNLRRKKEEESKDKRDAKEVKFKEDRDSFHLSSQCKDDNIIAFMRVCRGADKKSLIIDVTAIRPIYRTLQNYKKIAVMIAKFAEEFLKKEPQYQVIWYTDRETPIHHYFLRKASDEKQIQYPIAMEFAEGYNRSLIANRELSFYTELIYAPYKILDIKEITLLEKYEKQDILKILLAFGNLQAVEHFINLLSEADLIKFNPIHLASHASNISAIQFFVKYHEGNLLVTKNWPSSLISIIDAEIDIKEKNMLVEWLLKNVEDKTKWDLLTAKRPSEDKDISGTNTLSWILITSRFPEQFKLYILNQWIPEKISELFQELTADPTRLAIKKIIELGHHDILRQILSYMNPEQIESLFTSEDKKEPHPLLIGQYSLETFKVIVEHLGLSRELKQNIILSPHNAFLRQGIFSFNIAYNNNADVFRYLFIETNLLNQEQKNQLLQHEIHKNNNIIHHHTEFNNTILLQHLFSLDEIKFPFIKKLLFSKNDEGKIPIEIALKKMLVMGHDEKKTVEFLLHKMFAYDKEQSLQFLKKQGRNIAESCNDKNLPWEWLMLVNQLAQNYQLHIGAADYLPVKYYSALVEKLFVIPNISPVSRNKEQNFILSMIHKTLISIKKHLITDSKQAIFFNLLTGLFNTIQQNDSKDASQLLKHITDFEIQHKSIISYSSLSSKLFSAKNSKDEISTMLDKFHTHYPRVKFLY